ncbi:hypothetical protein [Streptomyces sp. MMS24-I29]|uniref:hypothetical protein n=1 Tax=Streptomyces sp. MMS24-I29 TaxID=3351480 RepID=UPI003C7B6828
MTDRPAGVRVRGDKIPRTYTEGAWPHDAVPQADAPPPVHYSLTLARALDSLCARRGFSHRALSLSAGLAPNAVGRIVRGELYPDLATLARLEVIAQEPLYPQALYQTLRPPRPDAG